jgi:hypothetical protein
MYTHITFLRHDYVSCHYVYLKKDLNVAPETSFSSHVMDKVQVQVFRVMK